MNVYESANEVSIPWLKLAFTNTSEDILQIDMRRISEMEAKMREINEWSHPSNSYHAHIATVRILQIYDHIMSIFTSIKFYKIS